MAKTTFGTVVRKNEIRFRSTVIYPQQLQQYTWTNPIPKVAWWRYRITRYIEITKPVFLPSCTSDGLKFSNCLGRFIIIINLAGEQQRYKITFGIYFAKQEFAVTLKFHKAEKISLFRVLLSRHVLFSANVPKLFCFALIISPLFGTNSYEIIVRWAPPKEPSCYKHKILVVLRRIFSDLLCKQ